RSSGERPGRMWATTDVLIVDDLVTELALVAGDRLVAHRGGATTMCLRYHRLLSRVQASISWPDGRPRRRRRLGSTARGCPCRDRGDGQGCRGEMNGPFRADVDSPSVAPEVPFSSVLLG